MKIAKEFNKYDFGIILLIALLAFGNLGGAFLPIRVVGLFFVPVVLRNISNNMTTKMQQWFFKFFIFWFFYMLVTLLWTPNLEEGFKELAYYFIHFSLFFLIIFWAQKANKPLLAIIWGWIFILILTLPLALIEILTYYHLPTSKFDSDDKINLGGTIIRNRFASTTFLNQNTYVVIISFCLPFLIARLLMSIKWFTKTLLFIILFICIYVLFVNASRGGILCLIIYLISFFVFSLKYQPFSSKIKRIFTMFSILLLVGGMLNSFGSEYFTRFIFRMGKGGVSFTEDTGRFHLYDSALTLFKDSLYMGTGVGSGVSVMKEVTNGIGTAHNMFFEVLLQYGLLVFIFFCVFLYKLFKPIRFDMFNSNKFILFTFLTALIPLFVINSGYLLMPSIWILFSSLFIVGTYRKSTI